MGKDPTDLIIGEAEGILKKKQHEFIVGYRHAIIYIYLHLRPFFAGTADAQERLKGVSRLDEACARDLRLFRELGVNNEFAKGYLSGMADVARLMRQQIGFDAIALFERLFDLIKELKSPAKAAPRKMGRVSDIQLSANAEIISKITAGLKNKRPEYVLWYVRSIRNLEVRVHQFFTDNPGIKERKKKENLLDSLYLDEKEFFGKFPGGDELEGVRRRAYLDGFEAFLSAFYKHLDFDSDSLFRELDKALRDLREYE